MHGHTTRTNRLSKTIHWGNRRTSDKRGGQATFMSDPGRALSRFMHLPRIGMAEGMLCGDLPCRVPTTPIVMNGGSRDQLTTNPLG